MLSHTRLKRITDRVRYLILLATTSAQSGHPSSSLSAVELMSVLFFGGFFRYDTTQPHNPNNDRIIFSKGHASPLLYALYSIAGAVTEKEIRSFRKFSSRLEGHASMRFPFTEAPTGSLGQGLSIGLGMALHAQRTKSTYTTYVLLGDGEMAEGQTWEAAALAAHYKTNNLVGILDVNRLGQTGTTLYGHNLTQYEKKLRAFGWNTICIDGHNGVQINRAFAQAKQSKKPFMIIAKTLKGKGVPFMENKNGWHGKPLTQEQLQRVPKEILASKPLTVTLRTPPHKKISRASRGRVTQPRYAAGSEVATREAYGNALVRLAPRFPNLLVLDAEVNNSTKTEMFARTYPQHFFQMYIAEQNMVSAGIGLAARGNIVTINSFAAFLNRAADQIRMSQYARMQLVFVGSHAGASIGKDGASQMGLEDIAMFRALTDSVILYPSDAYSTERCLELACSHPYISYIRNTRMPFPLLYTAQEQFHIGGSKTLKKNKNDVVTIVAAGVTLHEALKANTTLAAEGIHARVIDAYSVKPIDSATMNKAARETKRILVVEDHRQEGGLADAVRSTLTHPQPFIRSLAVQGVPRSGHTRDVLRDLRIDAQAIVREVKKMIQL